MSVGGATFAEPIVSPDDVTVGATLIDFEGMAVGSVVSPLSVGGVTFSSSRGFSIFDISTFGASQPYPDPTHRKTLHPLPTPTVGFPYLPLVMEFEPAAQEVLVGWFDPNTPGCVIRAFDADGNEIESVSVLTGPAGGVHSAFVGIKRESADIARLDVIPGSEFDVYTIDHVHVFVPPAECVADTNSDGVLTPADFNAWIIAFNAASPACDQNADRFCTPADFNAWVLNFNAGC